MMMTDDAKNLRIFPVTTTAAFRFFGLTSIGRNYESSDRFHINS
jgi:hypothetical protein